MDGQLDKAQARKAVQALLQHAEKERESGSRKADLIKDEEPVTLVVATTTIPPKPANKPLQMYAPRTALKRGDGLAAYQSRAGGIVRCRTPSQKATTFACLPRIRSASTRTKWLLNRLRA